MSNERIVTASRTAFHFRLFVFFKMTLSTLPLSYCGNVHPAQTVDELTQVLTTQMARVQRQSDFSIAAGLWLPDAITRELEESPDRLEPIVTALRENNLICYTLNAFPFGNFHLERVKEQVYLPDWTDPQRLEYTIRCARLLARLLPDGVEGSISTVPLGFKALADKPDFQQQCITNLLELARQLDDLHDSTGRVIRLAIEPEPLCVLETTKEVVDFFNALRARVDSEALQEIVDRHLGVCYDVCHQSVEFEDVAESIAELSQNQIRINKVHITCAIDLPNPSQNQEGREFLADFAEPRYLHQTFRNSSTGTVSEVDLTAEFARNPPAEWLDADSWRIHFHVPVHADSLGPLSTTRADLKKALAAVAALEYAPHLEVETYTWTVMPGKDLPDVCDGLTEELAATHRLLNELPKP